MALTKRSLLGIALALLAGFADGIVHTRPALAGGPRKSSPNSSNKRRASTNPSAVQLARQGVDVNSLNRWSDSLSVPRQETVALAQDAFGSPRLASLPSFSNEMGGQLAAFTPSGDAVFFTVDPALQHFSENVVASARAPHVAIVMMDPATGKVLAIASRSRSIQDLALHSHFPAASLFKLVTAGAAIEQAGLDGSDRIFFRGGNYTLSQWNYKPDDRKDRRWMTASEALGKSCNPVFGRMALKYLSPYSLQSFAQRFGFNAPLGFDAPLLASQALVPSDDFGLSLTGAGFGEVTLSPVHAASIVCGIARGGVLPRPYLIDRVVSASGKITYKGAPQDVRRMMSPAGSDKLMRMMEATTTVGTSRGAFMHRNKSLLPGVRVAAKTGTLSGDNPKGVNNWFVAAAPLEKPEVALAIVVVNPSGASSKASHLGRVMLQRFFDGQHAPSRSRAAVF